MWSAIPQIGSWFSLAAFVFAVLLLGYRQHLRIRIKVLETLPTKDRAKSLAKEINTFGIDAKRLTREQQFALAIRELKLRALRYYAAGIVVAVISISIAGISFYAFLGPLKVNSSSSLSLLTEANPALEAGPISPTPARPAQSPARISSTNSLASQRPQPAATSRAITEQPIYVFSSSGQPEDQDLADDLASALKNRGLHVTNSKTSAAVLVDISGAAVSDKTRSSSSGIITYYAVAQASANAIWATNGLPVFPDPVIDGEAQGGNTYDVREDARAKMIDAAVRRFQSLTEK